jgi:hypothetical protein
MHLTVDISLQKGHHNVQTFTPIGRHGATLLELPFLSAYVPFIAP